MTAVDRLLDLLNRGLSRLPPEEQKRVLKAGAGLIKERLRRTSTDAEIDMLARELEREASEEGR